MAIFLLGESHGWRSLEGYSPWGHKESDTTEATEHASKRGTKLKVSLRSACRWPSSFPIAVQLIYSVVLVSGVQQTESVIHIHISTLFQILFPYRSLQSTELSSLCYTVGSYQLSILYKVVCICQSQSPNVSHPLHPLVTTFVFYICNSISLL